MPSETEIERLVVRLVGDGTEYADMIEETVKETEQASKEIDKATEKIEDSFKQVGEGIKDLTELAEENRRVVREAMEAQFGKPDVTAPDALSSSGSPTAPILSEAQAEAQEEVEALARSIADLQAKLELQNDTFGQSATAVAVYQLKLRGATDEQLRGIQFASDQIELKKAEAEAQKEAARAAEESVKSYIKEEEELQRLIDEEVKLMNVEMERIRARGQEVTKSVTKETPSMKHAEGMKELNMLLKEGAINQDTFNKAASNLSSAKLKAYGDQITSVGQKISLFVTAPLVGLGALSLAGFSEAERGSTKLDAAIEATGRSVRNVRKDYDAFAATMQKQTVLDDDATLALLQQAESLGVTGEAAKRAAQNAIALQAARGIGAAGAMRMTVALEQGNADMLTRMLPTLRNVKGETEKVAVAQKLLANMFSVAKAEVNTFSGQMAQMRNEIGNAQEVIGGVITEAVLPLIKWVKEAALWFQELPKSVQTTVVIMGALAAAIGPIVILVGQAVTGLASFMTVLSGMGGMAGLMAGLANPIVLVGAALGAAVVVALALNAAIDSLYDEQEKQLDRALELEIKRGEALDKQVEAVRRKVDEERKAKGLAPKFSDIAKGIALPEAAKPKLLETKDMTKLGELKETLEAQIATIGKTGHAAELYKMKLRTVDEGQLAVIASLEKLNEEYEKGKKVEQATKNLENMTKELEAQTAAIGKNSEQARILKEATEGASAASVAAAEAALKDKEIKTQLHTDQEALKTGTQSLRDSINESIRVTQLEIAGLKDKGEHYRAISEEAAINKLVQDGLSKAEAQEMMAKAKLNDSLKEEADLIKKGIELKKSLRKPTEVLSDKSDELKKMLDANAITLGEYNRGLMEVEKQAHKDYTANFNVKGVDAVAAGSAEALARMREYQLGSKSVRQLQGMTAGKVKPAEFKESGVIAGQNLTLSKESIASLDAAFERATMQLDEGGSGYDKGRDALFEDISEGIGQLIEIGREQLKKDPVELAVADLN